MLRDAVAQTASMESLDVAYIPRILGNFQVGRCIASGGMGVVFEAHDIVLGRRVALKVVRPELATCDQAQVRLLREAQALASLNHRNVVTLYEVGMANGHVFVAMELVEGCTLREWMQAPRDWRDIVDLFVAFGRGLAAAHELGLVHRDVNPSNVFLARDGTPKLGDFGLARAEGERVEPGGWSPEASFLASRLTAHGTVIGTPAYMAPEQTGGGPIDARADQYAFCRSLHEAIAGELPEAGAVAPGVPRVLRAALARGLAADADARFPSLNQLLRALQRARREACKEFSAEPHAR